MKTEEIFTSPIPSLMPERADFADQDVPPEMRTLWSHFSRKPRPSIATITMSQNGV